MKNIMKGIVVPTDVTLTVLNQQTTQEEHVVLKFVNYLIDNPLNHPSFGENFDLLDSSDRVIKFLQSPKAPVVGEKFQLSIPLWDRLNTIVNYPKQPYDPKIARQLLPFFRAIKEASDDEVPFE